MVTEIAEIVAGKTYPYVIGQFIESEDLCIVLVPGQAYTEFWGDRLGYAVLDGHLSFDETAAIAALAGFSHFRKGVAR